MPSKCCINVSEVLSILGRCVFKNTSVIKISLDESKQKTDYDSQEDCLNV